MSDKFTIKNIRSRRNGFLGSGLMRMGLGEESKNISNNQFIASLIMNSNNNTPIDKK